MHACTALLPDEFGALRVADGQQDRLMRLVGYPSLLGEEGQDDGYDPDVSGARLAERSGDELTRRPHLASYRALLRLSARRGRFVGSGPM